MPRNGYILLLMLTASLFPVSAQSPQGNSASDQMGSSPAAQNLNKYLFGNWWGVRDKLSNRGIQPTVLIITDPFGNLTGGERRGFTDYILIGLNINFDTEKMGGWRGGQFIGGSLNFGNNLSTHTVGNTFPIQLSAVETSQPRLAYLSYSQDLAEGKINLLLGRLTVNALDGEEFMGSAYFKVFASVGFDLVPQGLFLNAPGASGYPETTWGGRLRYAPTSEFYVQAGVYNGDSNQKDGSYHGIDLSMRGPLFTIGEAGFRWNYGVQKNGLARNLKFGGYYDAADYKNTYSGSQTPKRANGVYGLYILGDQQIWRWPDTQHRRPTHPEHARLGDSEHDRHLGVFGALLVAPQGRVNTLPYFFDVGIVAYGPAPRRPKDFAALGFVNGFFRTGPLRTGELITPPSSEQTIELTYGFTLRPGLLLQPDLQYILHPRGTLMIPTTLLPADRVPNAFAAGINLVLNL